MNIVKIRRNLVAAVLCGIITITFILIEFYANDSVDTATRFKDILDDIPKYSDNSHSRSVGGNRLKSVQKDTVTPEVFEPRTFGNEVLEVIHNDDDEDAHEINENEDAHEINGNEDAHEFIRNENAHHEFNGNEDAHDTIRNEDDHHKFNGNEDAHEINRNEDAHHEFNGNEDTHEINGNEDVNDMVGTEIKNLSIFGDETLQQNDPRIISYIQKWHLHPPAPREVAYNLQNNWNPSQMASAISKIFKGKRNGIFIEAGACDGEFFSNTLDLEQNYNWTGLLVEPNSFLMPQLLGKNRKAWISDACLSVVPHPEQLTILHHNGSKVNQYQDWFKGNGVIAPSNNVPQIKWFNPDEYTSAGKTDCFPLYSILAAINMTKIDFFSLDVEGVELKILNTIPFDLVDIQVLAVEFSILPEGQLVLETFMKRKGYKAYLATLTDLVFIKNNSEYTAGPESGTATS